VLVLRECSVLGVGGRGLREVPSIVGSRVGRATDATTATTSSGKMLCVTHLCTLNNTLRSDGRLLRLAELRTKTLELL